MRLCITIRGSVRLSVCPLVVVVITPYRRDKTKSRIFHQGGAPTELVAPPSQSERISASRAGPREINRGPLAPTVLILPLLESPNFKWGHLASAGQTAANRHLQPGHVCPLVDRCVGLFVGPSNHNAFSLNRQKHVFSTSKIGTGSSKATATCRTFTMQKWQKL